MEEMKSLKNEENKIYHNLKEKLQKRLVRNIGSGESEAESRSLDSRGSEQLDFMDLLGFSVGKGAEPIHTSFTPKSGGLSKNWKRLRTYVFTAFKK